MTLRDEIFEQPDVAARLLADEAPRIRAVGAAVAAKHPAYVVIAARGSSDHAAIHAQYAFGLVNRLPVALAAPSLVSLYGVEPRFAGGLVIGISQSGASPDICETVEAARGQGVPTIAITNNPTSRLAVAAEHVIDLHAGPERSVAATKTYTAELLGVTLLALGMAQETVALGEDDLAALPERMHRALAADAETTEAAAAFATADACTVIGRGFGLATAREWALKLKELAQVVADPYSAADFQHGPVALVGPEAPVFLVAPSGAAAGGLQALGERLARDLGANLLVLSDRRELRRLGRRAIALPPDVPELLSPIVSILPAQLFAMHLATARGIDPERPRHLTKVTETT